ncbi:MAG: DegV family protein [Bacillota bacterium]
MLHGNNPEAAGALRDLLSGLAPGSEVEQGIVGCVVGAHAGPGVYGVAFYRI